MSRIGTRPRAPLGGAHGQPPEAAPRRVRRRTGGVVAVMRYGLPAASLGLIAMFLYYSGFFEKFAGSEPPPPREKMREVSRDRALMVKPRIARFDRKSQSYVVTAETAEQDKDNPALVLLDQINIDMRLRNEFGLVNVTAARGSYDSDKEFLRLVSNIRVTTQNGYTAELSSAEVFLKDTRLVSNEPVTINMPFGTLQANGIEMSDKGKQVRFVKGTRLEITRTSTKAAGG